MELGRFLLRSIDQLGFHLGGSPIHAKSPGHSSTRHSTTDESAPISRQGSANPKIGTGPDRLE
jgi:hypothetical protein